jgi:hypothetical protein
MKSFQGKKLVKSTAYGETVQQEAEMHSLKDSLWAPETDKHYLLF